MQKRHLLTLTAALIALAACTPMDNAGQPKPLEPSGMAVITKLEVAQTHVIPPEGKSWTGDKLSQYNLHLVADREALVLVDLQAPITEPVLEARVNGQAVGEVPLNPPATLPSTEASGPAYSASAYWATLQKAWVKPGLELRVRAKDRAASAPRAVRVGMAGAFALRTLPFYLFGLTEAAVPLSQTATADVATRDEYFAKHPFANLEIANHTAQKVMWPYIVVGPRQGRVAQRVTYKEQQGDGFAVMSAVLNVLGALREANGDGPVNAQYYAPLLMADKAGKYSAPGGGLGGGHVGTGDFAYEGIFIHEAGHAFGMPHANDGYQSGDYPYVGGSLKGSNWGYDQRNRRFLAPFVPTTASTYKNCAADGFPMGRQMDAQGRCIKQDPMQSGAGDQATGDKYTMFSDFNASVVQNYLEGTTTLKDGKRTYSGGRYFPDASSPSGYSRWDSVDARLVPVALETTDKGLYGLDNGLPVQRGVAVRTVVITAGIGGIADTNKDGKLDYSDQVTYDPAATQIYEPVSYQGNLRRVIDPTNAADRASIVPNTGALPWYCRNSGCDYTLKVTYADGSVQHILLHTAFREWFGTNIKANAANPTSSDSYRIWGVNIPAAKALQKLEVLETPEVWNGLPAVEKVIASRLFN